MRSAGAVSGDDCEDAAVSGPATAAERVVALVVLTLFASGILRVVTRSAAPSLVTIARVVATLRLASAVDTSSLICVLVLEAREGFACWNYPASSRTTPFIHMRQGCIDLPSVQRWSLRSVKRSGICRPLTQHTNLPATIFRLVNMNVDIRASHSIGELPELRGAGFSGIGTRSRVVVAVARFASGAMYIQAGIVWIAAYLACRMAWTNALRIRNVCTTHNSCAVLVKIATLSWNAGMVESRFGLAATLSVGLTFLANPVNDRLQLVARLRQLRADKAIRRMGLARISTALAVAGQQPFHTTSSRGGGIGFWPLLFASHTGCVCVPLRSGTVGGCASAREQQQDHLLQLCGQRNHQCTATLPAAHPRDRCRNRRRKPEAVARRQPSPGRRADRHAAHLCTRPPSCGHRPRIPRASADGQP